MLPLKLPNINATVIAVTNTATSLRSLIDTAGSANSAIPSSSFNEIIIVPEDGNVRIMHGNLPTSSKGLLLQQGTAYPLKDVNYDELYLIRTGSANVAVSLYIG